MDNELTELEIENLTERMQVALKSFCISVGIEYSEELFDSYVILFNLSQLRHKKQSENLHRNFTDAFMETIQNNPNLCDKAPL
jgi:hypothetical protein